MQYNPSAKLPFTIAKNRSDYGTEVIYQNPNKTSILQVNYTEGLLIDYRYARTPVDAKANILSIISIATLTLRTLPPNTSLDTVFRTLFVRFLNSPVEQYRAQLALIVLQTFKYSNLRTQSLSSNYKPRSVGRYMLEARADSWTEKQNVKRTNSTSGTDDYYGSSVRPELHQPAYEVSFEVTNVGGVDGCEVSFTIGKPLRAALLILSYSSCSSGAPTLHLIPSFGRPASEGLEKFRQIQPATRPNHDGYLASQPI